MKTTTEALSQDLVDEFIDIAHGQKRGSGDNLTKVKGLVTKYPALVHAVHSDGDETGIGAAAHMGEREIVQYLLVQGAPLDIATAAMMGWRDKVTGFLRQDSSQVKATGAHGCALLYFAALSGDTKIADMILEYGGTEGLKYPLQLRNRPSIHGAVSFGHLAMTQWFLDHGVDLTVRDYDDHTPLESAVVFGYHEIADLLRNHIGEGYLERCSGCKKSGYRVVTRREGNRWGAHTAYYKCHVCSTEMGSHQWTS